MTTLQLLSTRPLAGKSALTAALGASLANTGARLRLLRAGSGPAAEADATTFGELLFASTTGRPVTADELPAGEGETVIVEMDSGAAPLPGKQGLIVVRGEPSEDDIALAKALGSDLLGTIATRVPRPRTQAVARALTDGGMRPLALLPEDRLLAAPSVNDLRRALGAAVLYDGENGDDVVDDVLIGPVYADPARPHFRRFASKAVLAPYNKTDLHLAAIETQAACLVITGGGRPSPYVADRARGETTTVLLADKETPETVAALSDVWLTSRFRAGKAASARTLLESHLDIGGFAAKLR